MPRSTLRCASVAGALCLTATTATATAVAQTPAHATKVGVSAKRLNVLAGSRVTVTGRVRAA